MIHRLLRCAAALLFVLAAAPAALAQSAWDNVARVVVIGDLHGDYPKFAAMLTEAGLIDARGHWSGGQTHLVQLGDVPDRGADTRKILDLLMRLEPQAQRAGGQVHALIGNHEAMNIEGDLRYVSAGEYAAFADRNSARKRDTYYRLTVDTLTRSPPPGGLPTFDETYRKDFDARFPLGYVEHRHAWATHGTYGAWVLRNPAVIRINDTLYMHAGIGPEFPPATLDGMNAAVRGALTGKPDPALADITTNQQGPLWYRGLALNAEAAETANLEALLARYGVKRIVIGHTKRAAAVLPRFGGRVIITDVAVPEGGVDPRAFLIAENGALSVMHRGQRVPFSDADPCAYFTAIAALDPPGGPTQRLAANCGAPGGASVVSGSGS